MEKKAQEIELTREEKWEKWEFEHRIETDAEPDRHDLHFLIKRKIIRVLLEFTPKRLIPYVSYCERLATIWSEELKKKYPNLVSYNMSMENFFEHIAEDNKRFDEHSWKFWGLPSEAVENAMWEAERIAKEEEESKRLELQWEE